MPGGGGVCSICRRALPADSPLYGCPRCGYDACETCADGLLKLAHELAKGVAPAGGVVPGGGGAAQGADAADALGEGARPADGAAGAADGGGKGRGKNRAARRLATETEQ